MNLNRFLINRLAPRIAALPHPNPSRGPDMQQLLSLTIAMAAALACGHAAAQSDTLA